MFQTSGVRIHHEEGRLPVLHVTLPEFLSCEQLASLRNDIHAFIERLNGQPFSYLCDTLGTRKAESQTQEGLRELIFELSEAGAVKIAHIVPTDEEKRTMDAQNQELDLLDVCGNFLRVSEGLAFCSQWEPA